MLGVPLSFNPEGKSYMAAILKECVHPIQERGTLPIDFGGGQISNLQTSTLFQTKTSENHTLYGCTYPVYVVFQPFWLSIEYFFFTLFFFLQEATFSGHKLISGRENCRFGSYIE